MRTFYKAEADGDERLENLETPRNAVTIAIAGKYTQLEDSYASVAEALKHTAAATALRCKAISSGSK